MGGVLGSTQLDEGGIALPSGRFAPSPTGPLHLGNLRTAVAVWELARGNVILRIEDLDRVTSSRKWTVQLAEDLRLLELEAVGEVVHQSKRFSLYENYLSELIGGGRTYECYCTRKEIREAASAPHGDVLRYPGTCRDLDETTRNRRRQERPPALRLRVEESVRAEEGADDIVLRRNDGVPAYNLAVVVDDALQGVTQVVRGIDLEPVTSSQVYLQKLLGFPRPEYVHVGLVVGPDGERLAKRHGSVTLADWLAAGRSAASLRAALLRTLEDRPIRAECPVSDIWAQ